jgi:lysophospholipase L1-like esterase
MSESSRVYVALGDSMSIDLYTGVPGGGAVNQFYEWLKWLRQSWRLDDRSANMCRMRYVPTSVRGDLITLTIGGNDLLADQELYLKEGLGNFAQEHLELLTKLREGNPQAFIVVGDIYAPQTPLSEGLTRALEEANAIIAANVRKIDARLAGINQAFRGHEQEYLCYDIEPSLKGAAVIASLFKGVVVEAGALQGNR